MKKKSTLKENSGKINLIENAKNELEDMIDLNPQIMLLLNQDRTVVRANKALLKLLAATNFTQILGHRIDELFACKDKKFFQKFFDNNSGYRSEEEQITLSDGTVHNLKFTLIGSAGEAELLAVIVLDTTEETKQAIHVKKEHKLEAVEEIVGALLHNLNQPLTVMLVRAQLIQLALDQGTAQSDQVKSGIQDIMRLTLHVSDMLKNIEHPKDYITEPYVGTDQILNIFDSGKESKDTISSATSIIRPFIIALEIHAPRSMLHAKNTSFFTGFLAKKAGLSSIQVNMAQRAAIVHDIGKLGIPDSILQKQGKLSAAESTIMKTHASTGRDLLQGLPSMLEESITALMHHEHYDGSGYPSGASKEDIPITARLVAIADAFDAMCANRSYRKAMTVDDAAAQIIKESGTSFDPNLVKTFSNCYKEMVQDCLNAK